MRRPTRKKGTARCRTSLRTVNTETPRIGAASSTERRRGEPRPSVPWVTRPCPLRAIDELDATARSGYTSIASLCIPLRKRFGGHHRATASAGARAHGRGLVGGLRAHLADRALPHPGGAGGPVAGRAPGGAAHARALS